MRKSFNNYCSLLVFNQTIYRRIIIHISTTGYIDSGKNQKKIDPNPLLVNLNPFLVGLNPFLVKLKPFLLDFNPFLVDLSKY